jgi:hypothetical protein
VLDVVMARLDGLHSDVDAWRDVTLGADYPADGNVG